MSYLALIALQLIAIAFLLILFLRKKDDRSDRGLLELKDLLVRIDARSEQLDQSVRASVQEIRSESSKSDQQARQDIAELSTNLRAEISRLSELLAQRLDQLKVSLNEGHIELVKLLGEKLTSLNSDLAEKLSTGQKGQSEQTLRMKETVESSLTTLGRDVRQSVQSLSEEVKQRLQTVTEGVSLLSESNEKKQEALRQVVEQKLDKLQESNSQKLEQMRATVDEKLHSTLEKRLTESFGLVTEQLGRVQTGLGEMKELAVGVGDLKRVLTNVKTRGGFAEVQLGSQLEQMLAPDQYIANARIKSSSQESVEFAIRIPNGEHEEMLLPIDAKFPKEDWERLEDALERGGAEDIAAARKSLVATVKFEAKKISEKYIDPPATTSYGVMYLPTEGLFAEVVRNPGLVDEIQNKYRVCVAGPTNIMALLTSLQMGFRTVAIQKKGAEVWKVLAEAKTEFGNFGILMSKIEKQVDTVKTTIGRIRGKTTTINRKLKDVHTLEMGPVSVPPPLGMMESGDDEDEYEDEGFDLAAKGIDEED